MGVQKREFGCAAFSPGLPPSGPPSGVQDRPFQSVRCSGGCFVFPSHQTSPSSVSATFVKIEFPASMAAMALGFVPVLVPGATPNNPASGLTA